MAPRTLAGLSTVLASAGNVAEALNALSQDIAEHDRNGNVVLFSYDARRDLLAERLMPAHEGMRTAQLEIALDHLPSAIRRTISAGKQFGDLGTESGDYQKLLGVGASPEAGVLLLRGLLVDGELAGVLALSEPKTRFGHRLSEKVAPAVDLFSLAFARLAERRAREEAVRTLEELTKALNEENARSLQDLQRKLSEARAALNGKGGSDSIRVSQLKRAIEVAAVDARATAERLSAVEEQVPGGGDEAGKSPRAASCAGRGASNAEQHYLQGGASAPRCDGGSGRLAQDSGRGAPDRYVERARPLRCMRATVSAPPPNALQGAIHKLAFREPLNRSRRAGSVRHRDARRGDGGASCSLALRPPRNRRKRGCRSRSR